MIGCGKSGYSFSLDSGRRKPKQFDKGRTEATELAISAGQELDVADYDRNEMAYRLQVIGAALAGHLLLVDSSKRRPSEVAVHGLLLPFCWFKLRRTFPAYEVVKRPKGRQTLDDFSHPLRPSKNF
jgi:hypothetical protein